MSGLAVVSLRQKATSSITTGDAATAHVAEIARQHVKLGPGRQLDPVRRLPLHQRAQQRDVAK